MLRVRDKHSWANTDKQRSAVQDKQVQEKEGSSPQVVYIHSQEDIHYPKRISA